MTTGPTTPPGAAPVLVPGGSAVACSGCGEDLAPRDADHAACLQKAAVLRAIDHLNDAVDRLSFAGKESQAGWHVEAALDEICPAFDWRFSPAGAV